MWWVEQVKNAFTADTPHAALPTYADSARKGNGSDTDDRTNANCDTRDAHTAGSPDDGDESFPTILPLD